MDPKLVTPLVVVAATLAVLLAYYLVASRGRDRRRQDRLVWDKLPLRGGRAKPGFVGRTHEIDRFATILTKWANRPPEPLRLLLVTGDPGIGKRALLEQFREQCRERQRARVGPMFLLDQDSGGPEKVMRDLAAGLEQLAPRSAAQFHARLQRLEDQRQGRPSPLQGSVQAAQGVATTLEQAGVPGAKVVAAGWNSGLVEQAVTQLEMPVDVGGLEHALVEDIRQLAEQEPTRPLLLALADIDARPGDPGSAWLRDTLLPRLNDVPVLVVASLRWRATHERLSRMLGPSETFALRGLAEEDRRRYAREVIGLKADGAIEQVVRESVTGSPKRLDAIKQQIETRPELKQDSVLPDWVFAEAGADVTRRLLQLDPEHPADGRVLRIAALLRWFNTELLEDVAAAAGLQPAESEIDVAGVIERAREASTVQAAGRGWTVKDDRRAIAEELRRLSPDVWRDVHLAAARHHHRRLAGNDENPTLDDLLAWRPPEDLEARLREREWLETLLEREYHLLALRPHEAAKSLCDIAATMLYLNEDEAARRLLAIDAASPEWGRNRVYLSLLFRAAWALKEVRVTDAATSLRELASTGGPTPVVTAAVSYRLGLLQQQMGDNASALTKVETAYRIVADGESPLWHRLAAVNATWLAWIEAGSGAAADDVLRRLDAACAAAAQLGDLELSTWIDHFRARIHEAFGNGVEARATYNQVLTAYEQLADPEGIASVRLSRAQVLQALGDTETAQEDIDVAEAIVLELGDDAQRAEVELVRTLMALFGRDPETADLHCRRARVLRPNDHGFVDQLGRSFYSAGYPQQARRLYEDAIAMARGPSTPGKDDQAAGGTEQRRPVNDVAVYHANLGRALLDLGENSLAADELALAVQLGMKSPELLRALLGLQRGDEKAAKKTADSLANIILRRAGWRPPQDAASQRLEGELLDALDEATAWLSLDRTVGLLERLIELVPDDPRLRYRLYTLIESQAPAERVRDPVTVLEDAVGLLGDEDPAQQKFDYQVELAEQLLRAHRWEDARTALDNAEATGITGPRWSKASLRVKRLARSELTTLSGRGADRVDPRIRVDVSNDLTDWFNPRGSSAQAQGAQYLFGTMLRELRAEVHQRTGVTLPGISFREGRDLPPRSLRIVIDDVARSVCELAGEELTDIPPDEVRSRTGVDAVAASCPWNGHPASWVDATTAEQLRDQGVATWDARGIACALLLHDIGDADLAALVDAQQAADLLNDASETDPDVIRRATVVLRMLVADGVSVADPTAVRRLVLEAPPETPARDIAESARGRLIGSAVATWTAAVGGPLRVISLSERAETLLVQTSHDSRRGNAVAIALDPRSRAALSTALRSTDAGPVGVLLASSPVVRASLTALIRAERLPFRVVEASELVGAEWEPGAVVDLPDDSDVLDVVEAQPHA